ncbi:MAG: hypothetical protein QNL88_13720, partial [Acidobacteriota bacterium]|nr:hypothetical protein [Acidobacteriota bacterium]
MVNTNIIDSIESKKRDLLDKSWEFEVRNSSGVDVEEGNDETNKGREIYTFVDKDQYKRWR